MRTFFLASAAVALIAGGASAQQRVVVQRGGQHAMPMRGNWQHGTMPRVGMGQSRWGSKVNGHWWGGVNAPGGWNAYRRPARGYVLPSYWISPRFYINNWAGYGLTQPTPGYTWVRYYDDAVLIDNRGSVYDVASDIDWDRDNSGYYADDGAVYSGRAGSSYYADRGYPADPAPVAPPPPPPRRDGSDGLAGAAVGAVAGGVAGNLIAGKGNRLGGTLIGAGVGAAAGYAIDRGSRHRRHDPRPPVAPDYPPPPPPGAQAYAPPPPPPPPAYGADYGYREGYRGGYAMRGCVDRCQSAPVVTRTDGGTVVTTTQTGGYVAGGYYYPAGSTTTVVVQSAPVVTTTTTTETYEDRVTYVKKRRAAPVRTKLLHRARKSVKCACR